MTETIISFRSPPVVEVVAGVAFDGSAPETGPLLAAYWRERLREHFPVIQQQPPYTPPVEQFPGAATGTSFSLDRAGSFPSARLWAASHDGQELLQLQPGWFACNWRKVKTDDAYDHWPQRRAAFEKWFDDLSGFLAREGAGPVKVTQCEVTYINHIAAGTWWTRHAEFERIFAVSLGHDVPHRLEQLSAQAQFLLEHDGEPYGRLHVKILPAFARDGRTPLYVLELTARGAPQRDNGITGAVQFLNLGRKAIDLTFVALTTSAMQEEWGREA